MQAVIVYEYNCILFAKRTSRYDQPVLCNLSAILSSILKPTTRKYTSLVYININQPSRTELTS